MTKQSLSLRIRKPKKLALVVFFALRSARAALEANASFSGTH
jgi:hypothetical protein